MLFDVIDDIIFGSARKEMCTEFEKIIHKRFQMSSMRELTFFLGLQVTQKSDGIFISQDKYVGEILRNFDFSTVKIASTPMETSKPLLNDIEVEDVDDSPFDLEAYTDSDYAGASLDRKSTTRGCQFLGRRLISWQCKKQTIVASSTTKAEYVVASSCCVKNLVFHSKTKHIEIRHHFIRDSNEKKLIQMIKIHTNQNVADLLTKAFDVGRFQYLITKTELVRINIDDGNAYWNEIEVKSGILKVNTARLLLSEQLIMENKIIAIVDGKEFTITEASVRRHLQLADVDGISVLPTTDIFDQLSLMGYVLTDDKLTFQKGKISP
ncbi:putative ribonuclease H-like domain-containing protein [Tanacetum coccineum]